MNTTQAQAHIQDLVASAENLLDVLNKLSIVNKRGEFAQFFGWLTSRTKQVPNPLYAPEDPLSEEPEFNAVVLDLGTAEDRALTIPGVNFTYGDIADLQYALNKISQYVDTAPGTDVDAVGAYNTLIRVSRPSRLR